MQTRRLDTAEIRRLAVLAEADPRSVRRIARGEPVRGLAGHRIRRVLAAEGYLPATDAAEAADPAPVERAS